ISTFNGVALSFAKEVLALLKEHELEDVTLVLGGALNENMDGSMLAVDVKEDLAAMGVNVENDLNKTVEIVRKIYEN
ncbi:MAG: methylmalonyl-CoA mutase, partial [Firmicutes bacterium]|nr:methylmalonyl-CoA mutase [Bacillota bacterium]